MLNVLYYEYMDLFLHVFLVFNRRNFDTGMFVLRSSILVQVSTRFFILLAAQLLRIETEKPRKTK